MEVKSNIALIVKLMLLIALSVIIWVLLSTMSPSERTKNKSVFGILITDFDKEKITEFDGIPILIIKEQEEEFVVWDLIPKFSEKNIVGCLIQSVNAELHDGARFIEPCRGVRYSDEGKVIDFSYPSALPMDKMKWTVEKDYLIVSKDT